MAATSNHEGSILRDLLDDFVDVQKKDTWDITAGHLNESKLLSFDNASRVPWLSSTKPYLRLKPPSKLQDLAVRPDELPPIKNKNMTETVMDFMLGPAGGVTMQDKLKTTSPASPSPELSFIDKEKRIPSDKNLIQELELPELMLPFYSKTGSKSCSTVKHKFLKTHHALPTKQEQYISMKDFENDVMQKKNAQERHSLAGANDIGKIERRLRKRLKDLDRKHIKKGIPSFYILQAYSDCWDEIIDCSRIYKNVYQRIKDEYDAYISELLDLQDNHNDSLLDRLSSLSTRSSATTDEIKKEEDMVNKLEQMAMDALDTNEKLRHDLKKEQQKEEHLKFHIPEHAQEALQEQTVHERKKDLEERVQDLHLQIDEQINELKQMKQDQKENYVPVIVCQRLEQGIKEAEVDIQKLLKQNDFLEKKIEKYEEDVEKLLQDTGADERDARHLWMKINASKIRNMDAKQNTT